MKINAQILYNKLGIKYPLEIHGERSADFLYSSAEFYMDNANHFYANQVYLATVEHLPLRPVIEKNVVLVCIGENNRLTYYKKHATVILIKKRVDFFEVYNYLKDIFEIYHNWESNLLKLLVKNPTIQDVLNCTPTVIERSIFILNDTFQYVASVHSNLEYQDNRGNHNQGSLDTDSFLSYLQEKDLLMDKQGAFFLDFGKDSVMCVNLFNLNDKYIGCIFVYQEGKPFIKGENRLIEYLGTIVERIYEINPVLHNRQHISLKKSLQTMMNEMPLSKSQKLLLRSSNYKRDYFCISVHYMKDSSELPARYLCSVFESIFLNSVFFEYNYTILGLIPISQTDDTTNYIESFKKKMEDLTRDMPICIGVSNNFKDLYMLRILYKQAEAAIENGRIYHPDKNLYLFSDFALIELVTNSLGGFPVDTYFPKGFSELLSNDRKSKVSYLETLSVFLDESMSYSKTARRLYIHRSTLVERINRIKNMLSIDLDNPNHRLHLQIILKVFDMENSIKDH